MSHVRQPHPTDTLSPAARLMLITIDQQTHRLVRRRRWRFRKALAMADGTRGPGGAVRARKRAVRELRQAGLIEQAARPGTYPLAPGSGASRAFGKVRRGIEGLDDLDQDLLVVLVWTGVLDGRLSRTERWHVYRRLRVMIDAPPPVELDAPGAIEPVARAAGEIVYRQEVQTLHHLVRDLLSGDHHDVLHDLGAGGWGGDGSSSGLGDFGVGEQSRPAT